MPELPEVETVVRELRPLLAGRRISGVTTGNDAAKLRLPWQPTWAKTVTGRSFQAARRRGKWIILDFAGGGGLLFHLGMTGQLTVATNNSDQVTHCHMEFHLDDCAGTLRYRDPRRFGGVMYWAREATLQSYLGERLGPEPWDLDPAAWFRRLAESRRPLKAILLDQSVVAGVGNIYADEALHAARLVPTQLGVETTRHQATRLRTAIVLVLDRAIASRGSTIRDYVGGSGEAGGFQYELTVYGREGEQCIRCRTAVRCIRLAGRATHFCPKCQKVRPATNALRRRKKP